ncbi:MAG: 5-formyltetrahydrofolate cyclo-ligase [Candidatus Hadarchaeales archaeon]
MRSQKMEIRRKIWRILEETGVARFPKPVEGRIPNFIGSEKAAERLCSSRQYRCAEVVLVSPDSPQLPVRQAVLIDGKRLVMASPRLRIGFIEVSGAVNPREAATIGGAMKFGREIMPWDLKVDLIVEGSVAVDLSGGRIGKGGGFGDLEFAILRECGAAEESTPVATTVHELQIVESVPVEPHDVPVDIIATPERLIETEKKHPKPKGIIWEMVGRNQMEEIPLLRILHHKSI